MPARVGASRVTAAVELCRQDKKTVKEIYRNPAAAEEYISDLEERVEGIPKYASVVIASVLQQAEVYTDEFGDRIDVLVQKGVNYEADLKSTSDLFLGRVEAVEARTTALEVRATGVDEAIDNLRNRNGKLQANMDNALALMKKELKGVKDELAERPNVVNVVKVRRGEKTRKPNNLHARVKALEAALTKAAKK